MAVSPSEALAGLEIDFVSGKRYNFKLRGKNELLAKAMGLHLGYTSVWDCTAGLAEDAWTLCRLGFEVTAFERNSEIFALLEWAHKEVLNGNTSGAEQLHTAHRLRLRKENSLQVLAEASLFEPRSAAENAGASMEPPALPDVVYLDPMFPEAGKTALPRKEMQILRSLGLEQEPVEDMLRLALKVAQRRVVLKRGLRDPVVYGKPQSQIKGKALRFDLYYPNGTPSRTSHL